MLLSQRQSVADAVRSIGVSEVTYRRWRQEFGGLKIDQVRRLRELEAENARLRRAVSDLTPDKLILQEDAKGNFLAPRADGLASSIFGENYARRSVVLVRCSESTARRNAISGGAGRTRRG